VVHEAARKSGSSNVCSVENLVEHLVEKPLPGEAAPA